MPSAPSSPERTAQPSHELALVSALVVSSYNRSWLSRTVTQLLGGDATELQRLSRLKARLLPQYEELLREATRPGRPPREPEPHDDAAIYRELLALVPDGVWERLPAEARRKLVASQERLQEERGLTQAQFCECLNLSPRTFRSWKEKERKLPEPAENRDRGDGRDPERKRKRTPRSTGRYDLTATMPGNQLVGDTSQWKLFGVPLYIVAVQDPGWRKKRLWESFAVDLKEDSEVIIETLGRAIRPGMQFVCDQGTPYLSARTREAVESSECEHAPQKEGTPTDKATKERAFRSAKDALAPIADLSNRFAEQFPAFRQSDFARAAGRVLLSCFLRVYETAPREGAHPLAGRSRDELDAIAQEQRERARAETRSVRLALIEIHREYRLPGKLEDFIAAHRHHALEDIQEAERRLRSKACRCVTKACDRYFAGILRNVREEGRRRRQRERHRCRRHAEDQRTQLEDRKERERQAKVLREQPEAVLEEGLDLINYQWIERKGALLAGGLGPGGYRLREALETMHRDDPYTLRDRAESVWNVWTAKQRVFGARLAAVRKLFDERVSIFALSPQRKPIPPLRFVDRQ